MIRVGTLLNSKLLKMDSLVLISYCNFLFYLSYFKVKVSYFIHVLCNVSIFFHVINRFLIVIVKAIVDTRRFQRNQSSGQGCVNNVTMLPWSQWMVLLQFWLHSFQLWLGLLPVYSQTQQFVADINLIWKLRDVWMYNGSDFRNGIGQSGMHLEISKDSLWCWEFYKFHC